MKSAILIITSFLSISTFDLFLFSKKAFLKNTFLKTMLSHVRRYSYSIKPFHYKRERKNYLQTKVWGTVRVVSVARAKLWLKFVTSLKCIDFCWGCKVNLKEMSGKSRELVWAGFLFQELKNGKSKQFWEE